MHINYSKKSLFIFLIFSLIVFVFYALNLFKTPNYNKITQKIQKEINHNYNILKKNTNEIKQNFNNKNQLYQKLFQNNLINNEDFTFLVFENDSLFFWANNFFNTEYLHVNHYKQNLIIHSQNGFYASYVIDEHPFNFVGLFHIKNDYPYQNQFLINNFNHKLYHKPLDAVLSFDKGKYNVFIDGNQFLFSINYISGIKISPIQESILFALFFILYVLLIFNLWYYVITAIKNNLQLKFFLFFSTLLAIKYILLYFQCPAYIYKLEIFSPQYFASSSLFPSLGDLILTVLNLFVFIFIFYRENFKLEMKKSYNKIINILLIIFCLCVSFLSYYFIDYAFEKFILNSNIYVLFNNFFELSFYSFWSALVFFLILLSAFYLSYFLFNFFLIKFSLFNIIHLFLIIMGTSIILFLIFTLIDINCNVLFVFGIIIFLTIIYLHIKKNINPNKISSIIIFVFFFSVFSTYLIYYYTDIKEKERRKIIAYNLASETDPIAEFLFKDIQQKLLGDTNIAFYLQKHIENEELLKKHLRNKYFTGYFSKYDFQLTVCGATDKLLIKPDNIEVFCQEFFKDIKNQSSKMTIAENLFQINQVSGRTSYLAEIPYYINTDSNYKTLYIELLSKYVPKQLGYPELLIDKSIRINKNNLNYDYAKYKNNELITQFGKYFYLVNSKEYGNLLNNNLFYFDLNAYNHLYYKVDSTNEVIVSKKHTSWIDIFATFSYLFIFYCLLWFILKYIFFSKKIILRNFLNFSNRVRFAMVFIVLISFISIGIVTLTYIVNIYNNKNYDNISEKAHSILIEIENKLSKYDALSPELQDYTTELLVKFSNVFFTDINLYDLNGHLFASSRDKIFSEGLISRRMNAEAYYQMISSRKTFFIHNENIGKLNYLSAYIPFRNYDNKCIAYINLPYFAKQSEQRKEISTFIAAFVNIYVFLIAFSIIIAVLISRYVTRPLHLIKEKLSRFQLGKTNEKIDWKRNDEIGNLVKEYNRLIDELSVSVGLLAQSERESAWREMAKQVAHEIKNPLTPMKLSVQHLQRTWKDNPEEWNEKLEKFTAMMIDQIETLSSIASSFSDFARMPVANNTVISLTDIIDKVIDVYKDITNVSFNVIINGKTKWLVFADEMQIKRAFDNIVKNAIQALNCTENGQIKIVFDEKNKHANIAFYDNGNGISEEEATKIFLPSFTTKTSGMGLGLAIVKNIIESYKGSISFESKKGEGTIFYVSLPLYLEKQ